MSGKLILSVHPVRRYRAPGYPSHADPDPLRGPDAPRYPWARGFAAALAGLTALAGPAFGTEEAAQHAEDVTTGHQSSPLTEEQKEKLWNSSRILISSTDDATSITTQPPTPVPDENNPFSLKYAGLPYVSSPFGTGRPNYLGGELALKAAERAFARAGVRLQRNVPIRRGEGEFIANGYDEKSKIGFVIAEWGILEPDALHDWRYGAMSGSSVADMRRMKMQLQHLASEIKHDDLRAKAEAAQNFAAEADVKAVLDECLVHVGRGRLSLEEAKGCEARAAAGEEFIAVISGFDGRFVSQGGWFIPPAQQSPVKKMHLKLIEAMPDGAAKQAAMDRYYKKLREEAAGEAMDKLEATVREYIDWARREGM